MSNPKEKHDNSTGVAKPAKPFTGYAVFFRLERMRILQSSGYVDEEIKASLNHKHHDPIEHPRPEKYKDINFPPYWYRSTTNANSDKNRKHRKCKGRMSLKELSQKISASWRIVDTETATYCKKLARAELKKYEEALTEFNRKIDQNAFPSNDHINADAQDSNGAEDATIFRVSKLPTCFGEPTSNCNMLSAIPPTHPRSNQVDATYDRISKSVELRAEIQNTHQRMMFELRAEIQNMPQDINVAESPTSYDMNCSHFYRPSSSNRNGSRKRRLFNRRISSTGNMRAVNMNSRCNEDSCSQKKKRRNTYNCNEDWKTYTCVPDWQAEDAMTLLSLLSESGQEENDPAPRAVLEEEALNATANIEPIPILHPGYDLHMNRLVW